MPAAGQGRGFTCRRERHGVEVSSDKQHSRHGSGEFACKRNPLLMRLAVILGGVASGQTRICGVPDTVEMTGLADALRLFGAQIGLAGGDVVVRGTGNGCLLEADGPLRLDGDPDAACLVAGLVASYDMTTRIETSSALASDMFETVAAPLRRMGTQIDLETGSAAMVLHGPRAANPVDMTGTDLPPVALATALLAGLNVAGEIAVSGASGPVADLFGVFGAHLRAETGPDGRTSLRLRGQGLLAGATVRFS